MARIDSFPLKAFKKIQDPYAQKVISYLGSYKGAFQSSGNADEDIYEYFLEKAEKRIISQLLLPISRIWCSNSKKQTMMKWLSHG